MSRAERGQSAGLYRATEPNKKYKINQVLSIIRNNRLIEKSSRSPPAMNTAMRTTLVLESVMVAMPLLVLVEEVRGNGFPKKLNHYYLV